MCTENLVGETTVHRACKQRQRPDNSPLEWWRSFRNTDEVAFPLDDWWLEAGGQSGRRPRWVVQVMAGGGMGMYFISSH